MAEEKLVTLQEFAKLTGHDPSYISQLIKPQQIIPEIIGGIHKYIDIIKYPPEKFKKQKP